MTVALLLLFMTAITGAAEVSILKGKTTGDMMYDIVRDTSYVKIHKYQYEIARNLKWATRPPLSTNVDTKSPA
jgi:hypothetical protein